MRKPTCLCLSRLQRASRNCRWKDSATSVEVPQKPTKTITKCSCLAGGPSFVLVFLSPHHAAGAPSFAESAVLVFALGAKGGSRCRSHLDKVSFRSSPCPVHPDSNRESCSTATAP